MNDNEKTVLMLLASMFDPQKNGTTHSFMFGNVGSPAWDRRMGASIYYDELLLLEAIVYFRKNGPPFVRRMPPVQIRQLLTNFIAEHYSILANEVWGRKFEVSYLSYVSDITKKLLVESFAKGTVINPPIKLFLFPIDVIQVKDEYESDSFFLIKAGDLCQSKLPPGVLMSDITSDSHPPFKRWEFVRHSPKTWLGVRSPSKDFAKRIRNVVLGAIALLPIHKYRYLFSGRKISDGWCSICRESLATGDGPPSTPALAYDLEIDISDHAWLAILSGMIESNSKKELRKTLALEYFYRSWFMSESERYATLYMALESVFQNAGTTQALTDAVRNLLGNHISEARIKCIAQLRAALIHGGTPEVYDSRKYLKYLQTYKEDPVDALELLSAECLRMQIFGELLIQKPDPNAEIIEEAIKKGRIPKPSSSSILTDK